MNKKLLFLFFLSFYALGQAPAIEWQKSYGGTLSDQVRKFIATSDGGYICIGMAMSSDGDLTTNHGDFDIWIVKTSQDGILQWQQSYGGSSIELSGDIEEVADGYVFAATSYSSDGDVVGHHGINGDFWIVKLDINGQILWQHCIGTTDHEMARGLAKTSDGGFIAVGTKTSPVMIGPTSTFTDEFYIVKLDAFGNEQWNKVYGGTYREEAYDVLQTDDGGYIVVGETSSDDGDVAFNHATGFDGDFWILKLSTSGEIEWQKSLGGTQYEMAMRVNKADGGYIISGNTNSDDGDVTGLQGMDDAWIVKIDENGEILWQRTLGGSGTDSMFDGIQTADGGFIFAGVSTSTDGDIVGNHGNYDAWCVKLDADGNTVWHKIIGGTGSDGVLSVLQTQDGGFVFAGHAGSADGDITENNGAWDMWLVKLFPEMLSQSEAELQKPVMYPNPATTSLHFSQPIDLIAITDISGKVIYKQSGAMDEISIVDFQAGCYFVEAVSQNGKFRTKFIKQ